MDCRDFEKDIYLYSELSLTEKAKVDDHIRSCPACSQLLQEMRKMQDTIGRISEDRMIPASASKLTSVIMSRINMPLERHRGFTGFFNWQYVRVSFSVVSVSMLCLFVFESLRDFAQPKKDSQANADGKVILSVKAFHRQAAARSDEVQLFAECSSPFRSRQYIFDCARNSMIRIKKIK